MFSVDNARDKPLGDWISAPRPNFVAMAKGSAPMVAAPLGPNISDKNNRLGAEINTAWHVTAQFVVSITSAHYRVIESIVGVIQLSCAECISSKFMC